MIFVAILPVILLGIISIGGTESIVSIIGTLPSVLLLTLITVLVVLMWSYYLARQVTRPIVELSAIASRISRGDLPDKELEVISSDEIGELFRAFNRMINTYRILDTLAKEEP
jgi:nitrogen fixation/metabolism regulation signal transduction histidine kinase